MPYSHLLTLTSILALLAVTAIYIALCIFRTMRTPKPSYAPLSDEDPPRAMRKKRKARPRPLKLGAAGDCKIDVYELRRRSTSDRAGVCFGSGSQNHSVLGAGEAAIGRGEVEESEVLTPFSPARARARRYGAGDVGGWNWEEEEDGLGLGRYFFSDGVGIKRYVSWGVERGWREG